MADLTFKQRVAQTAMTYATVYESVYLKYEYLVCSEAFSSQDYYIIAACADNYRHLIGVNTAISAEEFFAKCLAGSCGKGFCQKKDQRFARFSFYAR